MALMISLFNILLVSSLSIQAQAHVCYVGQEPAAKNGYRWYIADRNPCKCTQFRLGGLNTNAQPRFSGEGGIYNIPFTTNKEKIRKSLGCEDASAVMYGAPCDNFTSSRRGTIEKVSKFSLPLEMELTVNAPELVILYFAPEEPKRDSGRRFTVDMIRGHLDIYYASYGSLKRKKGTTSWNFIGSAVLIEFDGTRIKVGLKGIPESFIAYDSMNPSPGNEWFIGLYANAENTVWSFYKPCGLFKD